MFEQIGEGHKIMAEGPKKEIDLDELERLAKAATPGPWDVSMKNLTIYDPFGDSVASTEQTHNQEANLHYIAVACNAVPGLIARIRELERQRDWLAKLLGDLCTAQKDGQCPLFYNCPAAQFGWSCGSTLKQDWIYVAEKEAGE